MAGREQYDLRGFKMEIRIDGSEIFMQQCDKCGKSFQMDRGIYISIVDVKKKSNSNSFVLCRSCYDKIQDKFLEMMGGKE